MGTPQFAIPSLELLTGAGYKPVLLVTQPDKPKGRRRKLSPPEAKIKAVELDIPLIQPEDVNTEEVVDQLKQLEPDLIVTVAYGGYLKRCIRKLPRLGCINLHPSLLPRYRGSSPLNYSLFNGDKETGITIFKIVAAMDAGPIIHQKRYPIEDDDNYTSLYQRMSMEGAKELLKAIKKIENNDDSYEIQDKNEVSFSFKIDKNDTILDWNMPAVEINNRIRGLSEKPGLSTYFRGKQIKIIKAEVIDKRSERSPGTIIEIIKNEGLLVSTGDCLLLIKQLQPAGKKIMSSIAFNLGARIEIGERFNSE